MDPNNADGLYHHPLSHSFSQTETQFKAGPKQGRLHAAKQGMRAHECQAVLEVLRCSLHSPKEDSETGFPAA